MPLFRLAYCPCQEQNVNPCWFEEVLVFRIKLGMDSGMKLSTTPAHEDRKHIFLSLLLSLLVKIPISPYFYPFPDRDSGVFAYIGRRILNGDLPYRDVWDHKPPLIFYLNALGLKIAPDSLWGIWLLSVILLAVAIFCSLKLLSRLFNSEIALVSTVIAMGGIPVLLGLGNLKTK